MLLQKFLFGLLPASMLHVMEERKPELAFPDSKSKPKDEGYKSLDDLSLWQARRRHFTCFKEKRPCKRTVRYYACGFDSTDQMM